jgi:hypothetical protein
MLNRNTDPHQATQVATLALWKLLLAIMVALV